MSRHKSVNVLLSTDEYEEIRAAAEAAGQPVSGYVRDTVMNHVTAPVRTDKVKSKAMKAGSRG